MSGLEPAPRKGSVPPVTGPGSISQAPAKGSVSQAPSSGSVPTVTSSSSLSQAPTSGRVEQPVLPPKKRRWGCCLGRIVLVLAVLFAGVLLWIWWSDRPSDVMTLGDRVTIDSEAMTVSGGTVTVDAPWSAIDGLRIEVPVGAYEEQPKVTLSTRAIKDHALGADFSPATPLISIKNGGEFAAEPMTVTIPVELAPDAFAMAFYYHQHTGQLEGIPLVDLTPTSVTLLTSHFSDLVVSSIPLAALADTNVDTGFAPGVDDWQFVNRGTVATRGGQCAGQSLTAMWYYYEKVLGAGERGLYGRYDNNDGQATSGFQEDDAWGQRWAAEAQRNQWDQGRGVYYTWGMASDSLTWYSTAYAMRLTGEPQYMSIGRYVEKDGKPARRGHALVAYKIEGNSLFVADPNYPGATDRTILFADGVLKPYSSGANARAIAAEGVRSYTEISYLAKTALIHWDNMGSGYKQMLKGKAGDSLFPPYNYMYVAGYDATTGKTEWKDIPDVLVLDEAKTVEWAGEDYRGKLIVAVNMDPRVHRCTRYQGTDPVEQKSSEDGGCSFTVPLEVGVLDLGMLIESKPADAEDADDAWHWTDFARCKVVYETPDLSGTWTGTWRIDEARNAAQFVEDTLTWFLFKTTLADSEQEAREIAAAAIEEAPGLYDEREIMFELSLVEPDKFDRYEVLATMSADDGSPATYAGEAKLVDGVVTITTEPDADGSRFRFEGQLSGQDALAGQVSATAWGVVRNALSGRWQAARKQ